MLNLNTFIQYVKKLILDRNYCSIASTIRLYILHCCPTVPRMYTPLLLMLVLAIICSIVISFSINSWPKQTSVTSVMIRDNHLLLSPSIRWSKLSRKSSCLMAAGELRIQIQGTKNAFTNVRYRDVLLYLLDKPITSGDVEKTKGLAVYGINGDLTPLCNYEEGSSEFYYDVLRSSMDAIELKENGRLLRIVSSDRKGENCFVLEEYIDSDVYIPIRDLNSKSIDISATLLPFSSTGEGNINDVSEIETELLSARYEAALLRVEVLQRKLFLSTSQQSKQTSKTSHRKVIATSLAPKAIGPYSQAIQAGDLLFVSGCIGLDPIKMTLVGNVTEDQSIQALENLKAIVISAGAELCDVVKTTIYLADLSDFNAVNKIYGSYFNSDPPARTTIEVSNLPLDSRIEIDAIVTLPKPN